MLKARARRCAYCGEKFALFDLKTIDHISPKYYGGDDRGTNLVVTCQKCNSLKGAKPFKSFIKTVNKQNIIKYLKDFGDFQLPTGEHYALVILKKFKIDKGDLK